MPRGHVAGWLQTPHAAQCQWPLLCEGAGARSRSACPPCAPPGAARSAGRPGLASSSSGAGLRRARRRRRRAPPGPGAGRRGSTPAFQNRRRESEARRRPPAAGPCEELTTYFQSTSADTSPLVCPEKSGSAVLHSLKTLGARRYTETHSRTRPDCPENSVSVLLCSSALTDSPPGFPASNLTSNAKERHGKDQAFPHARIQQQAALGPRGATGSVHGHFPRTFQIGENRDSDQPDSGAVQGRLRKDLHLQSVHRHRRRWIPVKKYIEQDLGVSTEREQAYWDEWDEAALRRIIQQQRKITEASKKLECIRSS